MKVEIGEKKEGRKRTPRGRRKRTPTLLRKSAEKKNT
jgi:hypothetical protein